MRSRKLGENEKEVLSRGHDLQKVLGGRANGN